MKIVSSLFCFKTQSDSDQKSSCTGKVSIIIIIIIIIVIKRRAFAVYVSKNI